MQKIQLSMQVDHDTEEQCFAYAIIAIRSIMLSCENVGDDAQALADEILETINRYGFSMGGD